MHKRILHLVFALVISCLTQSFAYSQQPIGQLDSKDKWIRVQSDNGEFSIEVPAKYKFYYNKDGIFVRESSTDYRLTNMRMLNTYNAGTLLSFEMYEAKKDALNAIYNQDIYKINDNEKSVIKRSDHSIRQSVIRTDKSYLTRQYFSSKTHIYILTAITRGKETPELRRFLDSLIFKPNIKDGPDSNAILLSKLPVTEIDVEQKIEKESVSSPAATKPPDKPKDENIIPVTIFSKPRASFTEQARQNRITGTIRLKITLSEDGFIPHIVVVKTLPEGLLRQALFSAIRIKFLPKENQGKPETVVVTVEYSFDIY
ncbi:hypothetical protein BH18ACI3_BH18ACI3_21430 [soil metagenome]